jgi:hypothetical protein
MSLAVQLHGGRENHGRIRVAAEMYAGGVYAHSALARDTIEKSQQAPGQ